MSRSNRSEAELERLVLLEFGRLQRISPDQICMRNEVGVGYRGALKPALELALSSFGDEVTSVVRQVMTGASVPGEDVCSVLPFPMSATSLGSWATPGVFTHAPAFRAHPSLAG